MIFGNKMELFSLPPSTRKHEPARGNQLGVVDRNREPTRFRGDVCCQRDAFCSFLFKCFLLDGGCSRREHASMGFKT